MLGKSLPFPVKIDNRSNFFTFCILVLKTYQIGKINKKCMQIVTELYFVLVSEQNLKSRSVTRFALRIIFRIRR